MKLSIICSILKSYIPTYNYLQFLDRFLSHKSKDELEVIFIDDRSDPPIFSIHGGKVPVDWSFNFVALRREAEPGEREVWTEACCRNLAFEVSQGDVVLFQDIDHIFPEDIITEIIETRDNYKKLQFRRYWGVIEDGNLVTDLNYMIRSGYGLKQDLVDKKGDSAGVHWNSFAIHREIFRNLLFPEQHGYGGFDVVFSDNYRNYALSIANGNDKVFQEYRSKTALNKIYVYPDPASDAKSLFHGYDHSGRLVKQVQLL